MYENTCNYFVSYAESSCAFRRLFIARLLVIVCVVIGAACLTVSNAVSYMSMAQPFCWWALSYSRCLEAGPQKNFWSMVFVPPVGPNYVLAQFVCVPIALALCVASLSLGASWLAVGVFHFHERREADSEREAGEEPSVLTLVGIHMKSARKGPSMYHRDELARRHFTRQLSVANLVLHALTTATTVCALVCHRAHLARLHKDGGRAHHFFACVCVATFFFLVATILSAIPKLVGFECACHTDEGLPSDDNGGEQLGGEEGRAAAGSLGTAQGGLDVFSSVAATGQGESAQDREEATIVMPVYAYSAAQGDRRRGLAEARPVPEQREAAPADTSGTMTRQCTLVSDAVLEGERAPPLYAHLDNEPAATISPAL